MKEKKENIKALVKIVSISVSPGLSVKIYLQKFSEIMTCKKIIVINKGNCFFIPLKKIINKLTDIDKKIIPIISARPAIAWLKKPRLLIANSSVKNKSCIE